MTDVNQVLICMVTIFNGIFMLSVFSVEGTNQCSSDYDCQSDQVCHEGSCQNACRFKVCGLNSACSSANHIAKCICYTGYFGDANVECFAGKIKKQ